MALIRSFEKNGVLYPTAYSRIMVVHIQSGSCSYNVGTYTDEEARKREDPVIAYDIIPVGSPSALIGDVYKLAYDHLKTQPGFENAITYPDGDDVKPPADPPEPVPEPTQPEAQA